jgi:hypothetical protein
VTETTTSAVSPPEGDTGCLVGMGLCPVLPAVSWLALSGNFAAAASAMPAARQLQDMAGAPAA